MLLLRICLKLASLEKTKALIIQIWKNNLENWFPNSTPCIIRNEITRPDCQIVLQVTKASGTITCTELFAFLWQNKC